MSNNNMTYTVVGTVPEKLHYYDEICGAAFVNLYTLSQGNETISISPFDMKNKEHLFVLGVAKGLAGVLGKKITLDVTKRELRKLNRGIDKDCQMQMIGSREMLNAINPNSLLDFMREKAVEACGEGFTFGDIYEIYYSRKKGK